jgi:hypothetical protein
LLAVERSVGDVISFALQIQHKDGLPDEDFFFKEFVLTPLLDIV